MDFDSIVVGGGLAGLTAAAYLSRSGQKVAVYEQSRSIGGRAGTQIKDGFHLNQGPHALYAGGPAASILTDLGVSYRGTPPIPNAGRIVQDGQVLPLPANLSSIVTHPKYSIAAKLELTKLFASLNSIYGEKVGDLTVAEWLTKTVKHPDVRALLQALLRLSTYADCPEQQSARAAIEQLQLAVKPGVLYLDEGWQVLVDGLAEKVWDSQGSIHLDEHVIAVEHEDHVRGVRLASGDFVPARSVILSVSPTIASKLAPAVGKLEAERFVPVKMATLDLGLRRLPDPRVLFGLGIDQPFYFSVHSAAAKLAPEGQALIHAGKYLGNFEASAEQIAAELEHFVDLLQPGWRDEVIVRRFLPNMVVANALDTPLGRASVASEIDGLYFAGDWVGAEGMLADAAMASAKRAAESAIMYTRENQSVGCNA
jgi:phytoene dehydrogenase-like protein